MSVMNFCPVPEEQQPLNEFKALQVSWFFRWGLVPWPTFLLHVFGVWLASLVVTVPVTAVSFPPQKGLGQFIIVAALTATIPLWMVLSQLYFGWRYICDRLQRQTITYEESGWFDGQLWQKPEDILLRDRLIVTYQLQPFMKRMEYVFLILVLLLGVGGLVWQWV